MSYQKTGDPLTRPVAFITGASSGIGQELARQLGKKGYAIALVARRRALLHSLQLELSQASIPCLELVCDVCDQQALEAAVHECEEKLGAIDLLIANAGVSWDLPVHRFDVKQARNIYEVNVIGLMQSITAVLPSMLKRRKGHIVGISSLASFISLPRNYVYCASKSAVNAHLEGLALELKPYGISVTTICPGFIKTEMTRGVKRPMPMLMDLEPAVGKMVRAIEQGRRRLVFPLPLYLALRLINVLPFVWRARILGTSPSSIKDRA